VVETKAKYVQLTTQSIATVKELSLEGDLIALAR
jgi:hypothetical protein